MQDHTAAVGENINRSVWGSFDITDAAGFAENDFFFHDFVTIQNEPVNVLMFERCDEQMAFLGGEQGTVNKFDPADSGRESPVMNRIYYSGERLVGRKYCPIAI